ncbi:MAG TPA: FAD-dependent oxidoreductase [Aliidongia sp.]|nr:FAD-dependent oxidoreductase [Aliidongia sp.]
MTHTPAIDVAVVGAGVVGLATALHLTDAGREVALIDPNEPGSGASYGNAGTLADYGCVPVGNPGVLRKLPRLLFDGDSPFSLRWAALSALAPWLIRFLRQSGPGRARANAVALADLLGEALPAWQELAAEANVAALFRQNGCLYLFRGAGDFDDKALDHRLRAELGMRQQVLNPAEVAALEPALPPIAGHGVFFPDAVHVTDPAALTQALHRVLEGRGTALHRVAVSLLEAEPDGRIRLEGPGLSLLARNVVIAAGAWSRPLARQAGDRIPLDTERGYHLEFATPSPLLSRPVCPVELGFYLTPIQGRLRVAGTVELGGLRAPPNRRRLALLERGARQLFPHLGAPSGEWLGFRPSMPDSLPVIGRSRATPNLVYAFGHGHLGLTLAAVTGRLVAGLMNGRANSDRLAPFAAGRFHA